MARTHGDRDLRAREETASRLRMARAAKRVNQTETAALASAILKRISPDGSISREVIRKYEDEKVPYQLLSDSPARTIAIAEALDVDPNWLAPELRLTPDDVARIKSILAELVEILDRAGR